MAFRASFEFACILFPMDFQIIIITVGARLVQGLVVADKIAFRIARASPEGPFHLATLTLHNIADVALGTFNSRGNLLDPFALGILRAAVELAKSTGPDVHCRAAQFATDVLGQNRLGRFFFLATQLF